MNTVIIASWTRVLCDLICKYYQLAITRKLEKRLLLHSFVYIHCVSGKKNIPDVFSYNSRKHCRILIIFGRNVTEKVSNQKMH